jgi:hypothetical protein
MTDEAVPATAVESAPVVNPSWADAEREQKQAVADSTPAPQVDEGQTPPEKVDGISKRIDELTRDKYTLKGRAEAAERELNYWREQATKDDRPAESVKPVEKAPPKLADFEFDEEKYQKAVFDFHREAARTEGAAAARQEVQRVEAERAAQNREKTFDEREAAFITTHPEYQDLVKRNDDLQINKVMADIIKDSESGLEVALYLGRHPELAAQISKLPNLGAAKELGRIEALLEKPKPAVAAVPAPKAPEVAPAPPPPVPIKASEAPPPPPKIEAVEPGISKSPNDMSDKEFATWRRRYQNRR